uniref:Uncharacterized protein n=1 Tax=Panstrongylus lignarius TaxID=156445 RepID=A0A224XZF1_9HEMI
MKDPPLMALVLVVYFFDQSMLHRLFLHLPPHHSYYYIPNQPYLIAVKKQFHLQMMLQLQKNTHLVLVHHPHWLHRQHYKHLLR